MLPTVLAPAREHQSWHWAGQPWEVQLKTNTGARAHAQAEKLPQEAPVIAAVSSPQQAATISPGGSTSPCCWGSQGPVSREGCSELVCFRELEKQQQAVRQQVRGWDQCVDRGNGQQVVVVVQPSPVQGASLFHLRLSRAAHRGFGSSETWQLAQQI